VVWGFSQPIEDNMEEAVSGVKGALATKIYGDDLKVLEEKSDEVVKIMSQIRGIEDLGVFRVLGQPNLNVTVDRDAAARYQINVADVQDAVQTAVGGNALTQVLKGEARYDLTMRYLPQYRDTKEAIEKIRLLSPSGERVSLAQLCKISETDGASEVYREGNRRYVAIKYSVRGRDLGSTVEEAIKKVNEGVKLPTGYTFYWEGEYQSQKRANARLLIVLPITILIIFVILYTMFKSFQMGDADYGECCHRAHWRSAGALVHWHEFQCFVRRGIPGAVRRVGANRSHHAGIHQPASSTALYDRGRRRRRRGLEICGPS
jgi:heavy metal efflux system protein